MTMPCCEHYDVQRQETITVIDVYWMQSDAFICCQI